MKAHSRDYGPAVIWMISCGIFLLTLSRNFSAAHDSISYLLRISEGGLVAHSHHPAYHLTARAWLLGWSALLPAAPAHVLLEAYSAVWGAGALSICYMILRRRFRVSVLQTASAVAALAFSYGCWAYSISVEVYMPSVCLLLITIYMLTDPSRAPGDFRRAGLWHSLAILFHQMHVLLIPAVAWLALRERGGGRGFLLYACTGLVVTGLGYLAAGIWGAGAETWESWWNWVLGYTVGHEYWRLPDAATPLAALVGFGRSLTGAHFLFQIPGLAPLIQRFFPDQGLTDEIFLGTGMPAGMAWTLLALSLLIAGIWLLLTGKLTANWRKAMRANPAAGILALALVSYSLFFLFWMPQILESWITQMALAWLLLAGTLFQVHSSTSPLARFALPTLAALLFWVNYAGSIRLLRDPDRDWYYVEVREVASGLSKGDLVIVEEGWIIKDYFRYFTPAEVIASDEPGFSQESVAREIARVRERGGKIYRYRQGQSPAGSFIQSY